MMYSNQLPAPLSKNEQGLLELNDFLDKNTLISLLNEEFLESLLNELDGVAYKRDAMFWLTIARINELALFCAMLKEWFACGWLFA